MKLLADVITETAKSGCWFFDSPTLNPKPYVALRCIAPTWQEVPEVFEAVRAVHRAVNQIIAIIYNII